LIVFLVQGLIGILLFEWAYSKTERLRKMPKEFHNQFPAFTC
jgi:1-acyl-sn-glycerol-3-phosphate acyltransferase